MPVTMAAYSKLHKIYKELVRQNETVFEGGKEAQYLRGKQGSLKGLSKFTKNAYADYQEQVTKWEETCGTKVKRDTVCDRIIRDFENINLSG